MKDGARPARFPLPLDRLNGGAAAPAGPAAAAGARGRVVLAPQGPLQQAQQDERRAARHAVRGLGMDSALVRQRMVQRLREETQAPQPVLQAFATVERHLFVDTALAGQAYEDTSLPIGWQQTISKPSVVARMLTLLFAGQTAMEQGHLGRVLEIGTGCGYQAALLGLLARSVVSIERLQPLHERARVLLEPWRSRCDIRLVHGDGRLGHAPRAPFTSIIAAAGGEALPTAWLDQLAVGGRLVAPAAASASPGAQAALAALGGQPAGPRTPVPQVLWVVDRHADGLRLQQLDAVHFVPLKSGTA